MLSLPALVLFMGLSAAGDSEPVTPEQRHASRYFAAPSAFAVPAGEWSFSWTEVIYTGVELGLSDHLSVSVGTSPAVWLLASIYYNRINLNGSMKLSTEIQPGIHIAANLQSLVSPPINEPLGTMALHWVTLATGVVTLGSPSANFSLAGGAALELAGVPGYPEYWRTNSSAVVIASGLLRVSPNFALVTETWVFPGTSPRWAPREPVLAVPSLGVRFNLDRFAVDLAVARLSGWVPLPWLNLTWTFGGAEPH